jgi:predicted amidophosphoribosyltransferase
MLPIHGTHFTGLAIQPHLVSAGRNAATVRSELGEMLYQYRYGGVDCHMRAIASKFAEALDTSIVDQRPNFLLWVPPAPQEPEYRRMILLSAAISRATGIASAQHLVARDGDDLFRVTSTVAARGIAARSVLVLDDLLRSGATLNALCALLVNQAEVGCVRAVVGTVLQR